MFEVDSATRTTLQTTVFVLWRVIISYAPLPRHASTHLDGNETCGSSLVFTSFPSPVSISRLFRALKLYLWASSPVCIQMSSRRVAHGWGPIRSTLALAPLFLALPFYTLYQQFSGFHSFFSFHFFVFPSWHVLTCLVLTSLAHSQCPPVSPTSTLLIHMTM